MWKVGFALSFFKGISLALFEPGLLNAIPGTEPTWADDYSEFVIELTMNFGPHDSVGSAEHQLDNLLMKDDSHINKYIVEFSCLATQDEIACIGKPACLTDICTMVQGINMCYWECKSEITHQTKTNLQPSSSNSPLLEDPPSSLAPLPPTPSLLAKGRTCSDHLPPPLKPPLTPPCLTFHTSREKVGS
ncbi:hypothetical protein ID866_7272 [Astraeus odoratus]|nr:hypothetical protein ID866_7272 [Astraeus odoratus]